ncbi:MAG: serine/threonine-protein kinase [Sandaracinaceae bacterium]
MARCPTCNVEAGDARFCPADGTPLSHLGRGPASMPRVGDVVDGERYALTEMLGKGGMAAVFLAHSRALQQDVALKVLFPRWAEDRKTVTRFAREARAASRIDHDNVVKVYDFGYASEGFYFLAMERLHGQSLDKLIEGPRLRVGRAANLLLEVAEGVARAHELGVVHRDLKPDNIMVRSQAGEERITIVDFGLSKIESGDAAVTGKGDIIGTPDYMAPEQWQGRDIDPRVDVYSFGIMAYRLFSGELPYRGDTLIQKLQQHLYAMPLALGEHPKAVDLPDGMSDLVMRCMAKDPADRLPHVGKVRDALRALVEANRGVSVQITDAPITTQVAPAGVADLGRLGLLSEIRRLFRVRQARIAALIPEVLGANTPADVRAMLDSVGELEADLERAEEEVALAEAGLEEAQRAHRAKEAELRAQLVEANLQLAVARQALPNEVTNIGAPLEPDTIVLDSSGPGDAPEDGARLADAEARLAAFMQAEDETIRDADRRFDRALYQSKAAEGPLGGLYKELEQLLLTHSGGDRRVFTELNQIDQLVAACRSRLEMLERRRQRGD